MKNVPAIPGCALAVLLASSAFAQPSLQIQSSVSSVTAGQEFTVNVVASGVQDLFACQFALTLPTGTAESGITQGPFLGSRGTTIFIPGAGGAIGPLTASSLVGPIAGVNGSGTLATVTLTAPAAGPIQLGLGNVLFINSSLNTTIPAASGVSLNVTPSGNNTGTLVFTTQPAGAATGVALPAVVVTLEDQNGHTITGSNAAVTLTSTPSGVSSTVNAVNGVVSFAGLNFLNPGTYTLTATAPGFTMATSSAFPIMAGPPPVPQYPVKDPAVSIDLPSGVVLPGITNLTGGAVGRANGSIQSVSVSLDGTVLGQAAYGLYRPDIPCGGLPLSPGCPNTGFSYLLNTTRVAAGSHTLTVTGTDEWGNIGTAMIHVTIAASPVKVAVEAPATGTILAGKITVSGWVVDTTSSVISALQVKVDGNLAGNASYGGTRPDICAAYPSGEGCPNVGFIYPLNTFTWTPGSHVITVTAQDAAGNTGSASTTVTVPSALPIVYLESPLYGAVLRGTVNLEGWALSAGISNGAPVGAVEILLDGRNAGNASMGIARTDVCAMNPGRAACPNVGFAYLLDTTKLQSGPHILTVQATDSSGTPQSGSWTTRFYVVGQ